MKEEKVLIEKATLKPTLKENENGESTYYLSGITSVANVKNRNNRIYPEEVLDKAFKEFEEEYIKKNKALGELGHPEDGMTNRDSSKINYDYVSHITVKWWKEGQNYYTKNKILRNPIGENYVIPLLKEGVLFSVSTRGFGNAEYSKQEDAYIVTSFKLLCIDLEHDPSFIQAEQKATLERFAQNLIVMKEGVSLSRSKLENELAELKHNDYNSYRFLCEYLESINSIDLLPKLLEDYNYNYRKIMQDLILTLTEKLNLKD